MKGIWWTVYEPFIYKLRHYDINDLFLVREYDFGISSLYDKKYSVIYSTYIDDVKEYLLHCRQLTDEELMIKDILE